jgi:hypothetical protein
MQKELIDKNPILNIANYLIQIESILLANNYYVQQLQ